MRVLALKDNYGIDILFEKINRIFKTDPEDITSSRAILPWFERFTKADATQEISDPSLCAAARSLQNSKL